MKKTMGLAIAVLSMISSQGMAATGTTQATTATTWDSIRENFGVSYYGYFDGPRMENADSNSTELYNSFGLKVKDLGAGWSFDLNPRFTTAFAPSTSFTWHNVRARVAKSDLVSVGHWKLYGALRVEIPSSQSAFDNRYVMGPELIVNPNWSVGRWSVALPVLYKVYLYSGSIGTGNSELLQLIPEVSYQLSSKVSAKAYYWYAASVGRGQNLLTGWGYSTDLLYLETPIDVVSNVNVAPFFAFSLAEPSLESARFGLELSAVAF